MNSIFISIITINLNNAEGLKKTIESVVCQTYKNYEFIIIDGDSTDSTKKIIAEFQDKISYWISEPDTGIYNAMNKGIKVAKGKYCLFLNSGDYLYSNNKLLDIAKEKDTDVDLIIGQRIIDSDGKLKKIKRPHKIDFNTLAFLHIPHCSTLIKRSLFNKVGLYDENYKIVGDHHFFLKAFLRHNISYKSIDDYISVFDTTGISSNPTFNDLHDRERSLAELDVLPSIVWEFGQDYLSIKQELLGLKSSNTVRIALKVSKLLKSIKKAR